MPYTRLPRPPRTSKNWVIDAFELSKWWDRIYRVLGTAEGIGWDIVSKAGSKLSEIETRLHSDLQEITQADDTSDSTTAGKHVTDALVKKYEDHRLASQDVHGVGAGSSVVGTATTQTLTNKKFGGTADYAEFEADGTLVLVGDAHLLYGSMYGDNIAHTVTVAATDTFYEVGASISDGGSNGFTFQNAKELKCLVAGKYLVNYGISVETTAANQEVEVAVLINGTEQVNTSNHTGIVTANKPGVVSGTGVLGLSVDDLVSLGVANHVAAQNIVVSHVNLTLLQIGG